MIQRCLKLSVILPDCFCALAGTWQRTLTTMRKLTVKSEKSPSLLIVRTAADDMPAVMISECSINYFMLCLIIVMAFLILCMLSDVWQQIKVYHRFVHNAIPFNQIIHFLCWFFLKNASEASRQAIRKAVREGTVYREIFAGIGILTKKITRKGERWKFQYINLSAYLFRILYLFLHIISANFKSFLNVFMFVSLFIGTSSIPAISAQSDRWSVVTA